MPATCRCGREWTGFAQAHCPTCHRHFSTLANFDRHRPGSSGCQDPWVGAGESVHSANDADPGTVGAA